MLPFYQGLKIELDVFDWRFLNSLLIKYHLLTKPITVNQFVFSQYEHYFLRDDNDSSYKSAALFEKIANIFNSDYAYSNVRNVFHFSQISHVPSQLVPHIDKRQCVISIPLVPVCAINWYKVEDNNKMAIFDHNHLLPIYSYNYSHCVTLINTSIFHGVPNNNKARYFFQIGGFNEDIISVISKIKSKYIIS